ncbi:vacuolar ATP synthase subunit C [Actinidia rufa]|uniref:V-type proton ATPase subunit C n=1 Tax=Actinidia rufa TaxID=165716 RepID=A0A7J0GB37_9ERIC|nr:vacuolar ATP synthase subunit C [Actinidia rufa]
MQVFSSWIHFCAVRVFAGSILRYGLPPSFLSVVMASVKSEKKIRAILEGLCDIANSERIVPDNIWAALTLPKSYPALSRRVSDQNAPPYLLPQSICCVIREEVQDERSKVKNLSEELMAYESFMKFYQIPYLDGQLAAALPNSAPENVDGAVVCWRQRGFWSAVSSVGSNSWVRIAKERKPMRSRLARSFSAMMSHRCGGPFPFTL